MQGIQTLTKMALCRQRVGAAVQLRWMVGKASNRAAVHGSKLPVPDTIPKEEVETEINGAIEKNKRKRRDIENAVDSHLKDWQLLYVEDFVK